MNNIAIVVPTVRPERLDTFLFMWKELFEKHNVELIVVWDGDKPFAEHRNNRFTAEVILGEDSDLIYNKNDGVRNLGFAYVAKYLPDIEYIITLDDDVSPIGDTIQDHIDALNMRVPISWMNTASEYMRGFPYKVRSEAPVAISHGVWQGVKDWDAPTQLTLGNRDVTFYRGVIPKGCLYPMCGMNLAFKRDMLPYMYFAPMGYRVGLDRFADIWCGVISKNICDINGWGVVTGYAEVLHDRASNVWNNLQKEAKGLEMNEGFWEGYLDDPYFQKYSSCNERWERWINAVIND